MEREIEASMGEKKKSSEEVPPKHFRYPARGEHYIRSMLNCAPLMPELSPTPPAPSTRKGDGVSGGEKNVCDHCFLLRVEVKVEKAALLDRQRGAL